MTEEQKVAAEKESELEEGLTVRTPDDTFDDIENLFGIELKRDKILKN